MRVVRDVFGALGALLPILYCGGLYFYFRDVAGSPENELNLGLRPTLWGLSVVGLLLCIPLLFKILKIFRRPPPPRLDGRGRLDTSAADDKSGSDADAVIARYLARHAATEGQLVSNAPISSQKADAGKRPSFGRRLD